MLSDLLKFQLDFIGAQSELGVNILGQCYFDTLNPQGNGKPVITIPGFLASESSLLRLNKHLNKHGFTAQSWGQGRNHGPAPEQQDWDAHISKLARSIKDRISRLADEQGSPVSLVGQSLGGIHARELAMQFPDLIDRVIMLGSPTFHPYMNTNHNRIVAKLGNWVNRRSYSELAGKKGLLHLDTDHPPLPCISIHSPIDGVVDEKAAVIPDYIIEQCGQAAPRENIRILSTHIGMSINPWSLLAITDRLAQDRNHWEVFDPSRYFPQKISWLTNRIYPQLKMPESRYSGLGSIFEAPQ